MSTADTDTDYAPLLADRLELQFLADASVISDRILTRAESGEELDQYEIDTLARLRTVSDAIIAGWPDDDEEDDEDA